MSTTEIAQCWGCEPHPSSLPAHVHPAQSGLWLEKGKGVGGGPCCKATASDPPCSAAAATWECRDRNSYLINRMFGLRHRLSHFRKWIWKTRWLFCTFNSWFHNFRPQFPADGWWGGGEHEGASVAFSPENSWPCHACRFYTARAPAPWELPTALPCQDIGPEATKGQQSSAHLGLGWCSEEGSLGFRCKQPCKTECMRGRGP